jgi:hypothetical protein
LRGSLASPNSLGSLNEKSHLKGGFVSWLLAAASRHDDERVPDVFGGLYFANDEHGILSYGRAS